MKNILNNLRMFLWMVLLTGIAYPFLITVIAQFSMKQKADGDFLTASGKIVGARLIAQKFESDKYFWPRPSAVDFNPQPSGGSNLGPTSSALKKSVEERKASLTKSHGESQPIPSELLFASGSGLDPHISVEAAKFQVGRIVKARQLDPQAGAEKINALIIQLSTSSLFATIAYVNVLELNIALDNL